MKCKHCKGYENCEWRIDDECWYEPDDGEDYSTAAYREIQEQNLNPIIKK